MSFSGKTKMRDEIKLNEMIQSVDLDGSNEIDFNEFLAMEVLSDATIKMDGKRSLLRCRVTSFPTMSERSITKLCV